MGPRLWDGDEIVCASCTLASRLWTTALAPRYSVAVIASILLMILVDLSRSRTGLRDGSRLDEGTSTLSWTRRSDGIAISRQKIATDDRTGACDIGFICLGCPCAGVSSFRLKANYFRQGLAWIVVFTSRCRLSLLPCVATTSTPTCCDIVHSASPPSLSNSTWSIRLQFTPWNHVSTPHRLHILSPLARAHTSLLKRHSQQQISHKTIPTARHGLRSDSASIVCSSTSLDSTRSSSSRYHYRRFQLSLAAATSRTDS